VQVLEVAAEWKADKAASGLESVHNANPDVKAVYMQAGGVYLAPTLQALKRKNLSFPVGDPNHVVLVSNDGIPQELAAIRNGELDATVSQPADDYAKYGMYWIKKAMAGETFKAGPTDHGSTIVETKPGILEDQLPAPVVTKDNVDDKGLWGNNL
jgi:ribose transport system substrate-binding protein